MAILGDLNPQGELDSISAYKYPLLMLDVLYASFHLQRIVVLTEFMSEEFCSPTETNDRRHTTFPPFLHLPIQFLEEILGHPTLSHPLAECSLRGMTRSGGSRAVPEVRSRTHVDQRGVFMLYKFLISTWHTHDSFVSLLLQSKKKN